MNARTYICYVYFMNVSVILILTEGLPNKRITLFTVEANLIFNVKLCIASFLK